MTSDSFMVVVVVTVMLAALLIAFVVIVAVAFQDVAGKASKKNNVGENGVCPALLMDWCSHVAYGFLPIVHGACSGCQIECPYRERR